MINVELYIEGQRVDLFKDEQISLNLSVKNYQNLDKVFTDFTQTFTIPASETNNVILEHWYDKSVTTSFNPATKLEARIELNSIPFRRGLVKVNEAVFKGDQIDFYKVTFFGANTNLTKLFKKDYLNELDLSSYKVLYTAYGTAVADRVQSDNVLIPLISPVRNWQYITDTDADSIKYDSASSTGIIFSEFKPAIRLARIIDAIETKYSITINSTFFASADFLNLYMWAHSQAGYFNGLSSPFTRLVETTIVSNPSGIYDGTNHVYVITSATGSATNTFSVVVDITSGTDVEWDLLAYDESNNVPLWQQNGFIGDRTVDVPIARPGGGEPNQEIFFAIRSSTAATFKFEVLSPLAGIEKTTDTNFGTGSFHFTNDSYTDTLTAESLTSVGGLPRQTVTEFLQGLIKMFNLVVIPVSETEFNIEPLDDYYSAGIESDLTKYVHTETKTVKPASLYGQIDFKYKESETILAQRFRDAEGDGIGYGDLRSVILDSSGEPISSDEFTIELPFTNLVWEKLSDMTSTPVGEDTSIMVGKFFDEDFKPLIEKPVIFYYVEQQTTGTYPIALRLRPDSSAVSYTTFNLCYQFNTKTDAFTHSLNFGSEVNTFTLNDGTASTPSLYNDYWTTYIEGLYNSQQRQTKLKATLPMSVLIDLELNQTLIIGFNKYRINAMQVDLTTGDAELDLLNIIA